MKLLLDTNVFIWASKEPNLLTPKALTALSDPYNERYVSIASLWEMQIKHALGKLQLPDKIDVIGRTWPIPLAAQIHPIDVAHLGKLYDLPPIHRDPFDRLLMAQALADGMTVVTGDAVFHEYSVPVIW